MAIFTPRRAVAGACLLSALAGTAYAATSIFSIAPLLPAAGTTACFAGTFDGTQELRFGWSFARDEGPAPVLAMSLRFSHPPPIEPSTDGTPSYGYGFLYEGHIGADIKGKGRFRSPTQCGNGDRSLSGFETDLYCGIDCDGGIVNIARVPGRRALDVTWHAGGHLRMSSCGGGGAIVRAEGGAVSFRLEPAPPERCGSGAGRD